MFGPSGFFCFSHLVKSLDGIELLYAFAYKPPGPMLRGALDELMLAMCKGPHLPDAVVVVGLAEDASTDLLNNLQAESALVAQQRLKSRIPLLHASLGLQSGKANMTLLDSDFRNRSGQFRSVIEKDVRGWLQSGLRAVFDPNEVVLRAPAGYAYQKPSGSRSELFLKPDLALKSSAVVAFVALTLFNKLFSGRKGGFTELQTVFVDTMAIAPVAYGLRELLASCGSNQAFHIESFHSYGGFDEVRKPLRRTSLCLISASASMALHEQWLTKKEVAVDEVVTLLTLTSTKRFKDRALLAIDVPVTESHPSPAQLSIRIKGETFFPEQEPPKKVLLTDLHHRSDEDVEQFCMFAGERVFDVFRRPARSGSRPRPLFVDGMQLLKQQSFIGWLQGRLLHSIKAATQVIVFQDDPPSQALAKEVQRYCKEDLGLPPPELVSAVKLNATNLSGRAGVVVCAAVVGKGSKLLEVSRCLRDKHEGPRLYVIGYQVAETRGELSALDSNLRHSKNVPFEVAKFGKAAIGTQLGAAFASEVDGYYGSGRDSTKLPGLLKRRAQLLGSTAFTGKFALLPHGQDVTESMRLRTGFAYWPEGFAPQSCHAEVLATIAVILQRAREHNKLPEERRLATLTFRHVVLAPENFSRFNDGVLQAALLRCANPAELDYRGDHAASDFMKAVILRALARATQEAGEGILEFLLALSQRRLQLSEIHSQEVLEAAGNQTVRPKKLQAAIDFIIASPITSRRRGLRMPF